MLVRADALKWMLVSVTCCGILYAVSELAARPLPVPSRHWLVPQRWYVYGDDVFAAAFGAALGLGFVTVVPAFGYYVLVGLAIGLADPLFGAMSLATFAVTRVLPAVVVSVIGAMRANDAAGHNPHLPQRSIRALTIAYQRTSFVRCIVLLLVCLYFLAHA